MSIATCHTEGCENAGEPVDVQLSWADPDTGDTYVVAGVVCGPCGQPITDLAPGSPDDGP